METSSIAVVLLIILQRLIYRNFREDKPLTKKGKEKKSLSSRSRHSLLSLHCVINMYGSGLLFSALLRALKLTESRVRLYQVLISDYGGKPPLNDRLLDRITVKV